MEKNKEPKHDTKLNYTIATTWLDSEQVCSLLRISVRTLVNYRQKGILPYSQIFRKIYYKASDIEEYLERHYVKAEYQKERRQS